MAGLLIYPHTPSLNLSLSNPVPIRASLKPYHLTISPAVGFLGGLRGWKTRTRDLTVVTRAAPSTSSYIFAFVLPLSLIVITVLTSIRVADKLDRDFLEEVSQFYPVSFRGMAALASSVYCFYVHFGFI